MAKKPATKRGQKQRSDKYEPLPDLLTQLGLADVLGISTRQIRNLEDRGLPTDESTGSKLYPKRECQRWYIDFKQDEALTRIQRDQETEIDEAQRRKVLAEARLAEIKVAREEGTVVPLEVHETIIGEVADRLRAVIINAPSNYALTLERAGVDPAVAQSALEALSEDLVRALRGAADEVEADGDRADD